MLTDLTIREFLDKTASGDAVPGGGSVSALAAAAAAGLAEMVARLTLGRKGYESAEAEMKAIAEEAAGLREKLGRDIDRDSDAFTEVMAAFRLPKATDEEKDRRRQAIQQGYRQASQVPLSVASDALRIMEMALQVVKKGNPNAVTDGAVGGMMARTAVLGALYNVRINLGSIRDAGFVAETTTRVNEIEGRVHELEKEILSAVRL